MRGRWSMTGVGRRAAGWSILAAGLCGCQADYAADIHNQTPQPLFAQIMIRSHGETFLGAGRRLGPGDRAFVPPVRAQQGGEVFVTIDTLPNPTQTVSMDLAPGTNFLVVTQDGTSPGGLLHIEPKH